MAVTDDRKFTKEFVYNLLEGVKGKTLGEVDTSHQFARTETSPKITGIAGDVIEQSVFGYERDSDQECDIEIDGILTELKTTGVRVPKSDLKNVVGKTGDAYNVYLGAKEGISITGVTFEPTIQTDFSTSHFWEKSKRITPSTTYNRNSIPESLILKTKHRASLWYGQIAFSLNCIRTNALPLTFRCQAYMNTQTLHLGDASHSQAVGRLISSCSLSFFCCKGRRSFRHEQSF